MFKTFVEVLGSRTMIVDPNSLLGVFLNIRLNSCVFGTKFIIKKVPPYSQECLKNIHKNDYKYDMTTRNK